LVDLATHKTRSDGIFYLEESGTMLPIGKSSNAFWRVEISFDRIKQEGVAFGHPFRKLREVQITLCES
jgi:hypothetical protein